MSYLFFDTSAIVKNYCSEIGSSWVITNLDPAAGNVIILGELTLAEFGAAVALKQRTGFITLAEQTKALNLFLSECTTEFEVLEITQAIISRAVELTQLYPLRGYDAVQLAIALDARDLFATAGITDFVFVSADTRLLNTAVAEGLRVENPSNHP